MIQSGGFLCRLLGPLLKAGLPLMKNVINPLAKSILISLRLTTAALRLILKEILSSGSKTLKIANERMEDKMKIVKSLEDSGLLLKGVSETIQNEAKEQKIRFFTLLLGTLIASLLGNILAGKGINRAEEGIIRGG